MIPLLFFAFLSPAPACHPVHSDWIYGRDLAAAVPELSNLPPDLRVGSAPVPGMPRIFHVAELRRLAFQNQLSSSITSDVCFSWPVSVPSKESLTAAMKSALSARITETSALSASVSKLEIIEQSLLPAPDGKIVFPLSGLNTAGIGPALWRGYVQYAEDRRFLIWARVLLTVDEDHVVAAADLTPGEPIRADQVKLQHYSGPPGTHHFISDSAHAIGSLPRRTILAGTPLTGDMLQAPLDVERGAIVSVVVQDGAAHLEAQGIAEQSGRCGDVISVKNEKTAQAFRARIIEADTVLVVPGGPAGLVPEGAPL
jgi:flagella basal body P-ring formation protein FlgA